MFSPQTLNLPRMRTRLVEPASEAVAAVDVDASPIDADLVMSSDSDLGFQVQV